MSSQMEWVAVPEIHLVAKLGFESLRGRNCFNPLNEIRYGGQVINFFNDDMSPVVMCVWCVFVYLREKERNNIVFNFFLGKWFVTLMGIFNR